MSRARSLSNRMLTALVALAGALAACSSAPDTNNGAGAGTSTGTEPPAERPTAADLGEELFDSPQISTSSFNPYACSTCHVAATAPDDRLRTGAPLAGVVQRTAYWGGSEIDLLRAVNHCLKFFMLQDEPWTGQEPNAVALYAYLESLSEGSTAPLAPAPFTVVKVPVDLPDGDAEAGAALYDRACATCHGEVKSGDGKLVDYAPILPDDFFAAHPPPDYTDEDRRLDLVSKVRHGGFNGHPGQMPPFSTEVLSDADVSDLLAFLFEK